MSAKTTKTAGILISAAALVGSGMAVATPLFADTTTPSHQEQLAQASYIENMPGDIVRQNNVQGTFSFNQDVVSSNETIGNVFFKAASAVCASLPSYGENASSMPISVSGNVDNAFSATIDEMASEENAENYTMGCSCASNVAGGGAIANANVEGVSLETIAGMAKAL